MAPFIKQDDMEAFCAEIMSFAINPAYEPKPFVGLKGTLTSFDVRHLIWNITSRLGLGKGKPYRVELCINFIRTMFPNFCKDLDNSTLKNLRVTSTSDKIHIDLPEKREYRFIYLQRTIITYSPFRSQDSTLPARMELHQCTQCRFHPSIAWCSRPQ